MFGCYRGEEWIDDWGLNDYILKYSIQVKWSLKIYFNYLPFCHTEGKEWGSLELTFYCSKFEQHKTETKEGSETKVWNKGIWGFSYKGTSPEANKTFWI